MASARHRLAFASELTQSLGQSRFGSGQALGRRI
jgi:hypothetical protein